MKTFSYHRPYNLSITSFLPYLRSKGMKTSNFLEGINAYILGVNKENPNGLYVLSYLDPSTWSSYRVYIIYPLSNGYQVAFSAINPRSIVGRDIREAIHNYRLTIVA